MKTLFGSALLVLVLAVTQSDRAAAAPALEALFQNRFETHYQERRCGDNILGLVRAARDQGIALEEARILMIENMGYSTFGMINVELARGSGKAGAPGETNWYHHVILESEGRIYDFDYTNQPTVMGVREYFERMFLDEAKDVQPAFYHVGRENKLKDYTVEQHAALPYIEAISRRQPTPKPLTARLRQYLDRH